MQRAACVFRDHEVRDATRALSEGTRFAALVGPSGVGTSTVLRAVLARRPTAHGKATLVPCRGAASLDELLRRIADALGLPAPHTESSFALRSLLGARLDAGAHLLALDDLPGGLTGVDVIVLDWLAVAPELRVLVACTSPLEGAEAVAVRPFAPAEARSFLIEALARRRPARPTEERLLEPWLRHAGGLPIALEVVAARVAALGELPGPSDAWPELAQTLQRSLGALSPQASQAASDLATLRGAFSLRAARAVVQVEDADGAIEALRHASLLELLPDADEPRLRLLDALRGALTPSDKARARHASFFAALPKADPRELDDLLAAFDWLAERQPDQASEVALLLDTVLICTGPFSLHVGVLQRARSLPVAARRQAHLHRLLGRLLAMHGQAEEATRINEEGVRLCEAEGGSPLGWLLAILCYSARVSGDLVRAREVGLRAVAIGKEIAEDRLLSMALQAVGLVDQDEEDHAAALARFVLAEAHGRRAQEPRIVGICAANHAMSCIALQSGPAARQSVERACAQFASAGDHFHLSRMAWMEAAVLRLSGDLTAASRRITEALAVFVENGDEAGELEAAIEALVIARALGDSARIEALLADIQILAGRVDEASVVQRARRALRPTETSAASQPHTLRLLRSGDKLSEVWLDGAPLELGRRGPLRSILLSLGRAPGRSFSVPELLAIGWPGERMTADSGNARVYMTMRRLRAFGLRDLLVTDDVGYKLHESVQVVVDAKLGTVRFPGRARGAHVLHATPQAPPGPDLRASCRLRGRLWRLRRG